MQTVEADGELKEAGDQEPLCLNCGRRLTKVQPYTYTCVCFPPDILLCIG